MGLKFPNGQLPPYIRSPIRDGSRDAQVSQVTYEILLRCRLEIAKAWPRVSIKIPAPPSADRRIAITHLRKLGWCVNALGGGDGEGINITCPEADGMRLEDFKDTPQLTPIMCDGVEEDFAYIGAAGKVVLYDKGERNMQDSIAVEPGLCTLKEEIDG